MPRDSALGAALATRKSLRARLLETWPELIADDQALNDTLAGLDDLEEAIVAMLRLAVEREAMAGALGDLIGDMTERKRRILGGAESMRRAALQAMQDAGLRTIAALKGPDMTVTIARGRPKLIIIDESKVPDEFVKVERTPKKKEIAAWLSGLPAESKPSWVEWGNGEPVLSVRRS